MHPGLNAVSKLEDHYHFYGDDFYAGQGSREYDHTKVHERYFPQFDGWPEKVAEYPPVYPNVFLGLHCDHYWTRAEAEALFRRADQERRRTLQSNASSSQGAQASMA